MGARKLRTIEEANKLRADSFTMYTSTIEPRYIGTSIVSPFGGEILEDVSWRCGGKISIKCSETGRLGTMQTDKTIRAIIEDVSWDE
ncbi:hypothetical protein LCGC14_1832570 [marine sediment metagenome]|uniref:Uncharacterized protein n=1 Tax=marine sediment metagenome TaxID=412755 RepID=A0A0F9GFK0_9ZZZZ